MVVAFFWTPTLAEDEACAQVLEIQFA
jgi:hypothetical protein